MNTPNIFKPVDNRPFVPDHYEVIDSHTDQVVGSYKTSKRAYHRADNLDLAYGGIRYMVRIIWSKD